MYFVSCKLPKLPCFSAPVNIVLLAFIPLLPTPASHLSLLLVSKLKEKRATFPLLGELLAAGYSWASRAPINPIQKPVRGLFLTYWFASNLLFFQQNSTTRAKKDHLQRPPMYYPFLPLAKCYRRSCLSTSLASPHPGNGQDQVPRHQ